MASPPIPMIHQMTSNGLFVGVTNYGASLQDLRLTDDNKPLVLGLLDPRSYHLQSSHMGATAGRYANRIADGHITIDGQDYQLDKNENDSATLHGGRNGCGRRLWQLEQSDETSAIFTLEEEDGFLGFPGALSLRAHYQITGFQELTISYEATTTKPTFVNLAHHSYFRLDDAPDISEHELQIMADHYLPVTDDNLPLGTMADVADTPFDFRERRAIGHQAYDHNFCLTPHQGLRPIAQLYSPRSGIEMTVSSDQIGIQFYNAAHLCESADNHHGRAYKGFDAVCLEPQFWPNSPNEPHFPSALLRPEERYHQQLVLSFKRHGEMR